MNEVWKDIAEFEGWHQISNLKRVKRIKPSPQSFVGHILKGPVVTLCRPGKRRQVSISTLVREAFGTPRPVDLEGEIWKDVVGFENWYQISNLGRVLRVTSGKILNPFYTGGYPTVTLYKRGERTDIFVHTLVLTTFVGPRPPGHECHHKNEDGMDNRLENLEWVTISKHRRVIHPWNPCVLEDQ